ncbi:SLC13 family permease [Allochromatium vinosum]|uniref:Citrate transporter n=1 Tax=Allochromatium vinosum (strain ATCC 17899 / DSM 180 / NBRC 103801 / NCIMB 10441 / D) TaxID=572477 RepID=D3RUP6_ALLVD|nr:SLC13 family permease [Allochromatium vinosum]ADC62905.1 Citrate transporter [Allochromatium vinosum DSM 180]
MLDAIRALSKTDIAGAAFAVAAIYLAGIVPTAEIAWVSGFLLLTVFLFAFEVVSVDVAAITVMVLLGLTSLAAPLMGLEQGLVPVEHLFDGFASNAVISIIAVMIVGAGLDKTGIMSKVAAFIMRIGGSTEKRIIPLISGTVGVISSFMQNVGAAALFIPVVSRISARTGLPMSRLLMPMGFCALLGGTITMVGSSPLILLNDLILTSNQALPEGVAPMKTFGLFDVTPIGVALLLTGIVYFVLAGRLVLPVHGATKAEGGDTRTYFAETYGLTDFEIGEFRVPNSDSHLIGMSVDELEQTWRVRLVGVEKGDGLRFGADGVDRTLGITPGSTLALLGTADSLLDVANANKLVRKRDLDRFAEVMSATKSGVAEIVIPPGSSLIGKTARDVWMRKTYGLSLLAINRGGTQITYKTGGVRNTPFAAGDALVVQTTWADLARLEKDRNFVVVTTEYPHEELRPHKVSAALALFVLTISLILFTDLRLSVALLVGALGMVLTRVLTMEEAYQAVSWKTVFLLASLIPLGMAVEQTGTAAWIAEQTLAALGDVPVWVIQLSLAGLATAFTLVMSNVGATVLLVPLAVNMALGAGADPAIFALTVAIATSNSFLLPTHQVNALIMGPGGYRVADYMRAGSLMTVLFLVVALTMINLVM